MFVARMGTECSMTASIVGSMIDAAVEIVLEDARDHRGVVGELAVAGNTAAIVGPGMTVVVDNLSHNRTDLRSRQTTMMMAQSR